MVQLSQRFNAALVYATEAHDGQTRKGTAVPYVAHVLAVAVLALENDATEDEAIAALLHDTVEDCGGLPVRDDVAEKFGENVAAIVMGCTDTTETPKPPWKERKLAYLKHLESERSPSVLLVSACDKLHNVRSLTIALRNDADDAWKQFKGGKEGTLWYYRAVLDALRRRGAPARVVHELQIAVEELHRQAHSATPISDTRFPDG